MAAHFDTRETRDPAARERALFRKLPEFLAAAAANCPGWRKRLRGIRAARVSSRAALAAIPVLRKGELMEAQSQSPPFGGFADPKMLDGARYFMSPGPVWEPQAGDGAHWGGARAFHAAGIGKGDLVHCAISFHMTPGGMILDAGARAAGARVFPAGTGNTEAQIDAAARLRPSAYAGTPDFLKIMLDAAAGRDLSSIRKALVSGGALFPSLRAEYASRGIRVLQCYATADLGVIAFETLHRGKPVAGMIVNEDLIVEIVRPGTDEPVAAGEVGELVVTNFNAAYPLIRFGTGDLSALVAGVSPCGRTNMRIAGWLGRADQRTKVKGMFVDPKQVEALRKAFPQIARARLVVARDGDRDVMTLKVAVANGAMLDAAGVATRLEAETRLRGAVEIVASLPNDGKVIEDARDYSK
jgi:phenylacetate-CoA ligase